MNVQISENLLTFLLDIYTQRWNCWIMWKFSREGNDYLLQYSCLENPMDRGACLWLQSVALQRVEHNRAATAFTFHGNCISESYDKNRISYELYESYSGFFFFLKRALIFWKLRSSKMLGTLFFTLRVLLIKDKGVITWACMTNQTHSSHLPRGTISPQNIHFKSST